MNVHELKKCRSNQHYMAKAIERHERLIWFVIHRFKPESFEHMGVDLQDFYQIAVIGFMKAVRYFKHNKNTKFVTFATLLMTNDIKSYLMRKSHTIRIPDKEYHFIRQIKKYQSVGMLDKDICEVLSITQLELEKLLQCSQNLMPFVDEDDTNSLLSTLGDSECLSEVENLMTIESYAESELELQIVTMKYQSYTNKDISKQLTIPVKEVRTILERFKKRLLG